jgi:hypothetical protein
MIVITVELHSAITGKVTQLGKAILANTGGSHELGDYRLAVGRKGHAELRSLWARPHREAFVDRFPRLQKNVWYLLARSLAAAGYLK